MSDYFWLLGASDPEMEVIERVLRAKGQEFIPCTIGGSRVHPGNAYHAEVPDEVIEREADGYTIVVVECIKDIPSEWIRVDHHNPGDPGYGQPPSNFWPASSLGQVCEILGVVPTKDMRIAAAADHCLSHAYQGSCPGITLEDLEEYRARTKAIFQSSKAGGTVDEWKIIIKQQQEDAKRTLRSLPLVPLDDLGEFEVKCVWDTVIPELPDAAMSLGESYLAVIPEPSGNKKVVIGGGHADEIKAFLEEFVPRNGLERAYGDPARGFAGAYFPGNVVVDPV